MLGNGSSRFIPFLIVILWLVCFGGVESRKIKQFEPEAFFHFVQVTDVHVEDFSSTDAVRLEEAKERYRDFNLLATKILPEIVLPSFVIMTGDLTHAIALPKHILDRDADLLTRLINLHVPGQWLEQWKMYRNVSHHLNSALERNVSNGTLKMIYPYHMEINDRVFDLPGNHDSFGVSNKVDSDKWLFLNYSMSGKYFSSPVQERNSSFTSLGCEERDLASFYVFDFKTNFGTYRFVSLDATPSIGSYRPINFFSSFPACQLEKLKKGLMTKTEDVDQTLIFGHYPSSMITTLDDKGRVQSDETITSMFKHTNALAYFSGHLHHIFDDMKRFIPDSGHLEVQSPDFKKERSFTLIAMDNNRMSLKDFRLDILETTPGVLITSPKDCRYNNEKEPYVQNSTFIRLLVLYPFGKLPHERLNLTIVIDDTITVGNNIEIEKGKVEYRVPFDISSLPQGSHIIQVFFNDTLLYSHMFNTNAEFCPHNSTNNTTRKILSRFITTSVLTWNWREVFRSVTTVSCWSGVILVLMLKYFGLLQKISVVDTLALLLHPLSMRYGVWFLGMLSPDFRFGGFINLTYFYFNPNPLSNIEQVTEWKPLNYIFDAFNSVTIIDDSSVYFRLVGPTFVFAYLTILFGLVVIDWLDRFEERQKSLYPKTRLAIVFVILFVNFIFYMLGYYLPFVRSYGKYVLITSPNNIVFPLYGCCRIAYRTYKYRKSINMKKDQ